VVWVQEEPRNMGAWSFVEPRLSEMLLVPLRYEGRPERASPAEGYHHRHLREQNRIVMAALSDAPEVGAEAQPRGPVAKLIGKRK
jgi:2-oxoglutarate dehydrogenase E1 component